MPIRIRRGKRDCWSEHSECQLAKLSLDCARFIFGSKQILACSTLNALLSCGMTKSKKPKLNVRLLRRIQKHILEEPRRFFILRFKEAGIPDSTVIVENGQAQQIPECGTMACIGGWACILSGRKTRLRFWNTAVSLLGLTFDQADALFTYHEWPRRFFNSYQQAENERARRARIAAARIEHLIKTGK